MNAAVPTGYRHDPYDPDAFIVRCPSCESRSKRDDRPGPNSQTCGTCNRLMGVTPVSKADAPHGASETGQRVMTDGGHTDSESKTKSDVYHERNLLAVGFIRALRSVHEEGVEFGWWPDTDDVNGERWAVVWADLPGEGQVGWHVPRRMVPDWLARRDPDYDGYTTETKNRRVASFAGVPADVAQRVMTDGGSYFWDDVDCPRVQCDGDLQQQDEFNVMCLECEEVWSHVIENDEHLLVSVAGKIIKRKDRVMADGGEIDPESDRVDPERLPDTYTPAYVDVRGQGPVYVANYETLSSGWLSLKEWRGTRTKLPPHRVGGVREVRTECYDPAPDQDRYTQAKRVADEQRREQALPDDTGGKTVVDGHSIEIDA